MMITIYGLPLMTKYADLKVLIKQKCNIKDFILDMLMNDDDGTKKVRVGLADDAEGTHLIKCLDGYRLSGYPLRLFPVGKSSQANPSQQNTFNEEYQQTNDYHLPNRSRPGEAPPLNQWVNQWQANQPMQQPIQNTFNYQQPQPTYAHNASQPIKQSYEQSAHRTQQDQGFSQNYPQKSNLISLGPQRNMAPSAARDVSGAPHRAEQGGQFQPPQNYGVQEKPITIMKDKFQGPQYNLLTGHNPAPAFQISTQQSTWTTQHQQKPYEKPIQQSFEKKPYDDRKYIPSTASKLADEKETVSYKEYENPREFSPTRQERKYKRDMLPERVDQPSPGRRTSPGRRISSERQVYMDRRSPGRRISPHNRQVYPDSRRASPGRVISSDGQISPSRRHIQDTRMRQASGRDRDARHGSANRQTSRYSPSRHQANKLMDYHDDRPVKNVRPAYEPSVQASNEAKYPGGYRHNVREDAHYPVRGQERYQDKDFGHKDIENRRDAARIQNVPRTSDHHRGEEDPKRSRSGNRLSRSPRRDRSPVNRARRHSPSPRSPRRSWALEKRRSPDACEPPPPPVWPGHDMSSSAYQHQDRSSFPGRDHEKKLPVWEHSQDKTRDKFTRNVDREHFEEDMRRRQSAENWKTLPQANLKATSSHYEQDDSTRREDKFARKGFQERRDYSEGNAPPARRDRQESRYDADIEMKDNIEHKKVAYPGRIDERKQEIIKKQQQLQKEIDDVYKRAVDFTKKAQMYKKGELEKDTMCDPHNQNKDSDDSNNSYEEYSRQGRKRHKEYERARESKERKAKAPSPTKSKRNTAIEQIADKLLSSHGSYLPKDLKPRVAAELQLRVSKILKKMFGNEEVSFIELVIKFNSQHTVEDEEAIFDAVMSNFPAQYRRLKRPAPDNSEVPVKSSRRFDDPDVTADGQPRANDNNWNIKTSLANTPIQMTQVGPPGLLLDGSVIVPMPNQYQFLPNQSLAMCLNQPAQESNKDGHSLYLCKDDFQPIDDFETAQLKEFLVKELMKVTQASQGWAPDFTLMKQNSSHRHELITRDQLSRDWLLNLDFSEFQLFNVLVYTAEELWFERAAIWLPGHSRNHRNIEPLTKLCLQNKRLENINIGKWKFVKSVVNLKGTRLYVDMPPYSARALEQHDMQLSYEFQKVNVFLKSVAIDKEAFDAGLNERSIDFHPQSNQCLHPMPLISGHDKDIMQIAFKGNKPLTLPLARKVRDTMLYKLYRYHQLDGKSKTDFLKYGFCQPGFLCVQPENAESRKWLLDLDLGKINRIPLIIIGEDDVKNKYFNMSITLPCEMKPKLASERLRQSNQGVKGINFGLWRNHSIQYNRPRRHDVTLNVDMDLESVETVVKMKYTLDLVIQNREHVAEVIPALPVAKLEETLARCRAELSDTYDVANMDLASDSDD